jgi:hypothetical protein
VAAPIRVEWLEGREARDLVQALAVRGIVGKQVASAEGVAVLVHDPHETDERLLAELVQALEGWLADRGRDPVRVRVGDRTRTVGTRRDLAVALHERAQARRSADTAGEER